MSTIRLISITKQVVQKIKNSKAITTKTGRILIEEGIKAYPTYLAYKYGGPFGGTAARGYMDIISTTTKYHLKLHNIPSEKQGKMSYKELLDKKLLEDPVNLSNLGLRLIGFGRK